MATEAKNVRLVVRPHQPLRQLILAVLGVLLITLVSWMLLDYGHWHYLYDRIRIGSAWRSMLAESSEQTQSLEEANRHLREQVAILQRSAQIDKQATADVQHHLSDMQDQLFQMKEELEFYRGIVASSKTNIGLRVQGLRVNALAEPGRFHFKVVLTNVDKGDKVSTGRISVQLAGKQNGVARSFDLTGLLDGGGSLKYSFSHFHRVEGDLKLPQGFEPESIKVSIIPDGTNKVADSKSFGWMKVLE